jgi:hypothetical protein
VTREHVNTAQREHVNTAQREHVNTAQREHVNTAQKEHVNTAQQPGERTPQLGQRLALSAACFDIVQPQPRATAYSVISPSTALQ